MGRFSERIIAQLESFDASEGGTLSNDDRTAQFYLEWIAEELIEGREAFTGERFIDLEQALRNKPNITEGEIDRVLTIRMLSEMTGMVERVVSLSKLERVGVPSGQTSRYVREAARSYFYGLYQASASMSRVALEQALKEVLGRQGIEDFVPFRELRKEALKARILDPVTGDAAAKIHKHASEVIHHRPTDAQGALDVLLGSRGLIVQIYTAAQAKLSGPPT